MQCAINGKDNQWFVNAKWATCLPHFQSSGALDADHFIFLQWLITWATAWCKQMTIPGKHNQAEWSMEMQARKRLAFKSCHCAWHSGCLWRILLLLSSFIFWWLGLRNTVWNKQLTIIGKHNQPKQTTEEQAMRKGKEKVPFHWPPCVSLEAAAAWRFHSLWWWFTLQETFWSIQIKTKGKHNQALQSMEKTISGLWMQNEQLACPTSSPAGHWMQIISSFCNDWGHEQLHDVNRWQSLASTTSQNDQWKCKPEKDWPSRVAIALGPAAVSGGFFCCWVPPFFDNWDWETLFETSSWQSLASTTSQNKQLKSKPRGKAKKWCYFTDPPVCLWRHQLMTFSQFVVMIHTPRDFLKHPNDNQGKAWPGIMTNGKDKQWLVNAKWTTCLPHFQSSGPLDADHFIFLQWLRTWATAWCEQMTILGKHNQPEWSMEMQAGKRLAFKSCHCAWPSGCLWRILLLLISSIFVTIGNKEHCLRQAVDNRWQAQPAKTNNWRASHEPRQKKRCHFTDPPGVSLEVPADDVFTICGDDSHSKRLFEASRWKPGAMHNQAVWPTEKTISGLWMKNEQLACPTSCPAGHWMQIISSFCNDWGHEQLHDVNRWQSLASTTSQNDQWKCKPEKDLPSRVAIVLVTVAVSGGFFCCWVPPFLS